MAGSMKAAVSTLLGCLLTPVYLLVFGLLLVVFHPVQVLCRTAGGYGAHKKSVDIMNFLIVKSLIILGARVSFRGIETLPVDRPIILISNHQSLFDIPPIVWGFRAHHPKFIAKTSGLLEKLVIPSSASLIILRSVYLVCPA